MLHAVTRITIPTVLTERTQPTVPPIPSFDTPIDFPTAQPILRHTIGIRKGLIVVWVSRCAWDDGVPAVGMGRAFNPQDDDGVGLSVPDGVGGGWRRGAPPVAESG